MRSRPWYETDAEAIREQRRELDQNDRRLIVELALACFALPWVALGLRALVLSAWGTP